MPTRSRLLFAVTLISVSVAGYSQPKPPASAAPPDDGNWVMPAKNYASTRFSALAEITADNVGTLKVEATFSTGVLRGHEAAPIVYRDTMYIITPFPNRVYALDLTKPGLPQKWMYDPQPVPAAPSGPGGRSGP